MKALAWILVVLVGVNLFASWYAAGAGKSRQPYTTTEAVLTTIVAAMWMALLGRVLGWW